MGAKQRGVQIICTIGPASFEPRVLEGLIDAGMSVARLNFAHGEADQHREAVARIRAIAKKEIDAEVEAGRRRLFARATELAVELAQKKIASSMTDADRDRLIDRSVDILGRRR